MKLKLAVAAVGLAFSVPAMADYGGVYQSGSDNYANIDQTNSGAGAYISQTGDRNRAGFDYRPYGYDYQAPGIYQYNVNWGYASIGQYGNDNSAYTYQYYGDNQTINIQQGGWHCSGDTCTDYGPANNNYASFSQYSYGGANQAINVFQGGSGNYAYGYQQGSDNQMNVTQTGNYNQAQNLNQYGSGGDANVMNVSQNGNSNNVGYYYYYYGVTQQGSGNDMSITQDGSYNTVYSASQYGNNNSLTISQNGVGHYAYSSQYGSGNTAVITQR